MALGDPINVDKTAILNKSDNRHVFPIQVQSAWTTVVDAGGVDNVDAIPIVNPDTQITETTTHIFQIEKGTTLRIRMKYDDGLGTITAECKVRVFGRLTNTDPWMPLQNKNGNALIELTMDLTNDVRDGTNRFTKTGIDAHALDLEGCREFIVGIEVIPAGTGDVTTATIEIKAL